MCAIFGMVVHRVLEAEYVCHQLVKLAHAGEERGRDGTGVVVVYPDGCHYVFRSKKPASQCTDELLFFLHNRLTRPCIVIGANRYQPLPQPQTSDIAAQPICLNDEGVVFAHNGTLSEDDVIRAKHGFPDHTGIDSEVIGHLYRQCRNEASEEWPPGAASIWTAMQAVQHTLAELAGGIALALCDLRSAKRLFLVRNFKPLSLVYVRSGGSEFFAFQSERVVLEAVFGRGWAGFDTPRYEEIPAYSGVVLEVGEVEEGRMFSITSPVVASLPKQDSRSAVVICSGGMDSSTAAFCARHLDNIRDLTLLHIDYGQRAAYCERRAVGIVAQELDAKVVHVDARQLGVMSSKSPLVTGGEEIPIGQRSAESTRCWVAARNLLFLSYAAAFAEGQGCAYIYAGFNLEEGGSYPDNTVEFFQRFQRVAEFGTLTRPGVRLSIARLMKPEIVRLAVHLGVPLGATWSCDSDGYGLHGYACGRCGCCWTRRLAFKKAGVQDTKSYEYELEGPVPAWFYESEIITCDTPIGVLRRKASAR